MGVPPARGPAPGAGDPPRHGPPEPGLHRLDESWDRAARDRPVGLRRGDGPHEGDPGVTIRLFYDRWPQYERVSSSRSGTSRPGSWLSGLPRSTGPSGRSPATWPAHASTGSATSWASWVPRPRPSQARTAPAGRTTSITRAARSRSSVRSKRPSRSSLWPRPLDARDDVGHGRAVVRRRAPGPLAPSIFQRLLTHEAYHGGELSIALGSHHLDPTYIWRPDDPLQS